MKLYILIFFSISTLYSAPAFSKYRKFFNADGSSFIAKANGNEHLNWIETIDGKILKYNEKTKNFEYAKIVDNKLVTSGVVYKKDIIKKAKSFKTLDRDNLFKLLRGN
jgi:hypothetical protein